MNYCTVDDLLASRLSNAELVQLTNDAETGVSNPDSVAAAITSASAEIDGYLRGRLALPLNPVPQVIKDIATALAAYNLFRRRLTVACPESVRADYKDAIAKLDKIQRGSMSITDADASRGPGIYKTNKTRRDRLFGKPRLEEY